MRVSDVLHQSRALDFIARSLRRSRLPHGMIFSGPEGVGKQMFATRLARVLLCNAPVLGNEGDMPEACESCTNCEMSANGQHPDFNVVDRSLGAYLSDGSARRRKHTQLGVDIVREFLIEPAGLRPGSAASKVFLIPEADLLNDSSQNALLKTLEEPPNDCYLILLVSSASALLETTRSRCQIIEFDALPDGFVADHLRNTQQLDDAEINRLTVIAQGSAGRATWLATIAAHEHFDEALAAVMQAARDPVAASQSLQGLAKQITDKIKKTDTGDEADLNEARVGQSTALALTSVVVSEALRLASGSAPRDLGLAAKYTDYFAKTQPSGWSGAARSLSTAEYQIKRSFNVGLIFDAVGIALGRALLGKAA